jgi:hypothetical protein
VLAREQHVVGLDVAVHHPLVMRVRQGVQHLLEDRHRLTHRELPLAGQLRPERLALDVRHHVEEEVVVRARRQQRNDVGMLQLGGELDLPLEPLHVDARPHLGREHLDNHLAAEPGLLRQEDTAHPPTTELPLDAVGVTNGSLQAVREGTQDTGFL